MWHHGWSVVDWEIPGTVGSSQPDQPEPSTDLRELLIGWLGFQRQSFARKLRDLDASGVAAEAIPPLQLSILGLIRHMTQMEHWYLTYGLGGGEAHMVYGDDDYAGGTRETLAADLAAYQEEIINADRAIAALTSLDSPGLGFGWPLGATLIKMVQEYAVHNGQGHMLRYAALGEVIR